MCPGSGQALLQSIVRLQNLWEKGTMCGIHTSGAVHAGKASAKICVKQVATSGLKQLVSSSAQKPAGSSPFGLVQT